MHELSIAMSLVDVASEEAMRLGDVRVTALHVRIGPLSGVVSEALAFSFALAADGSPIAGAQLVVQDVPIVAHCASCDAERVIASPQALVCPVCLSPVEHLLHGRELELVSLEIEEDLEANVAAHR